MNPNQETRAYIARVTYPQARIIERALHYYGQDGLPCDVTIEELKGTICAFSNTLDTDALRLVLDAAKESTEREGESYDNLPAESRARLRKTISSIAKIESLIK